MNNSRRDKISMTIIRLEDCMSLLDKIKSEEEDSFDNMPENLQGSRRGEESEEAIDVLEDAINSLEECIDSLKGI